MKKVLILIFAVLISAPGFGCAVTDVNHLSTTNYVDRHLTPDNQAGQWLLTPVYIPVAVVTLIIDNFIIAPVVSLPSTIVDMQEFWDADLDGYYANAGFLPFRIVLTPVFFVLDWAGRTIFAADPEDDAWWAWPQWGYQWQRDQQGRLIGPPSVLEMEDKEQAEPPADEAEPDVDDARNDAVYSPSMYRPGMRLLLVCRRIERLSEQEFSLHA
ncbi:MAG: hypothetical protein KDK39_04185 [Leptospiraceae bacterium]|nr:hypothetical protein [Leptospiraceae bacterium]